MESAIISGNSKKDMQLLMTIAKKMGIRARFLSKDSLEDTGMAKAMDEGKTGEYVNTEEFLSSLR